MTELPDGWLGSTIGELAGKPQYGWTSSARLNAEGPLLLRTTDLSHGPIAWAKVPRCTKSPPDVDKFRLASDDIVVSRAGSVGLSALLQDPPPSVFASYLMRIRPGSKVSPRYLSLFLQSPGYWSQISAVTNGIAVPNINATKLAAVTLPLPPLDEQRRIVDILEDHLSRLDAAKSTLAMADVRLRALHKSMLMDLIPDVSAYPAHWKGSTVEEAGTVGLGRQRHPDWHVGPNMHPYLRVANVFEDRIDVGDVMQMHWPDNSFERFRLKEGDVLLNEGQSPEFLGRPAIYRGKPVDIAFTNTLIRFQVNEHVLPDFALLVFRRHMHAGRFARESRITTNIAHLSAARLKPIEFPVPPLDEQKRLVDLSEQRLGDAAHLRDQIRLFESRNQTLKRSLLDAAFSGRLTGRTSDMEMVEEMAGV